MMRNDLPNASTDQAMRVTVYSNAGRRTGAFTFSKFNGNGSCGHMIVKGDLILMSHNQPKPVTGFKVQKRWVCKDCYEDEGGQVIISPLTEGQQ